LLISCQAQNLKKIRGIEVQVLDDETNEPLAGICVWYVLQKSKPHNFVDSAYEIIILRKMETDENGIVIIEPSTVFLGPFQYISSESIFVNIDVNNENNKEKISEHFSFYFLSSHRRTYNDEKIAIPNNNYYPAFVCYFPIDYDYSYTKLQIDDFATNDYDKRFENQAAPIELKEEQNTAIKIRIRRRDINKEE